MEAPRQHLIDLIESLPDAVSEVGGDADQHVGFTVRKKRFAWYLDDHHDDGVVALTCKAPPGVNTQLATAEPDRLFIPSYTRERSWLGVRLDVGTVDWDEIARPSTGMDRHLASGRRKQHVPIYADSDGHATHACRAGPVVFDP